MCPRSQLFTCSQTVETLYVYSLSTSSTAVSTYNLIAASVIGIAIATPTQLFFGMQYTVAYSLRMHSDHQAVCTQFRCSSALRMLTLAFTNEL
jgi:hypothetical protein